MTVHSIKLTLLSALLSYCLAGMWAGPALAHSGSRSLASTPGAIGREPVGSGESSTQTPGGDPGQNQQEAPAGKRKPLHAYGPEDILPDARESENPGPRKARTPQLKANNGTPPASAPLITPATTPMVTPTTTPAVTPTPTPAESAMPAMAMTPSGPRNVKNPAAPRRKLLISGSLFLLLLGSLIYFLAKMRQQLREDSEVVTASVEQEQAPAAEKQQLDAHEPAAADRHVKRSRKRSKSLKNRVPKARHTCLLAGLMILASNTYGQVAIAGKTDQGRLHGGIEIDFGGVKAAVVRVSDAEQGSGAEVVYTEVLNTTLARTPNGRFAPEAVKATGQAVRTLYTRMQQQYQVPSRQVYIVGSSDLDAENLEDLADEVRDITGEAITFLSLESDVRLSIIGTIPRRYREGAIWFDNRSQSVLIDIGGGKTKGGYQQIREPLTGAPYYDFASVGIPKGTTTFTDEINQAAGKDADIKTFALSARTLSEGSVRTALRNELGMRPGLAHRKKVYLSGSIVQAMITLLRPEDRQSFIPITVNDINAFHQRAVYAPQALLNPDLSRIRDDGIRKEVERELDAVRSIFTPKSLIAGAEILKAVTSEYNFQEEGKKILFARFSQLSLILSYVRLQVESGSQP